MQIKLNLRNVGVACVAVFFVWLLYALWRTKDVKVVDLVSIDLKDLIGYCILAAERGGYAVERIYNSHHVGVRSKGKTSEGADEVLTQADVVSHMLIYETLQRLPGITERIISEESGARVLAGDLEQYKLNNYDVWLSNRRAVKEIPSQAIPLSKVTIWVDPLDATQEYSEGLVDYVSVMICIAVDGKPKFGVIRRPFLHETVWGVTGVGTFPRFSTGAPSIAGGGAGGNRRKNERNSPPNSSNNNVILVSRSHAGTVRQLVEKMNGQGSDSDSGHYVVESAGGSGYKTLRVLNGTANAYVHSTAIKKWDLCAPEALIRSAVGRVTTLDGDDITYFDKDDVFVRDGILVTLNEHFHLLKQLQQASSNATDRKA